VLTQAPLAYCNDFMIAGEGVIRVFFFDTIIRIDHHARESFPSNSSNDQCAIKMFRYFCGPQNEMSFLVEGDSSCSLCGERGPAFQLKYAHCPSLAADTKGSALGCFACLQEGRFEFWHDTEIGMLNENGLTHEYKHNQLPDFPRSALVELRRTPQIVTWQQELWLTHCNDFMAYIGTWEPKDFYANAPEGDARGLFHEMTDDDYRHLWDESLPDGAERLERWHAVFYAFRCLHCGKLRGNWDCD
jgi:uncharacterized protein CbrC (UPF0167 family)